MYKFRNPSWLSECRYGYNGYSDIPDEAFERLNFKLALSNPTEPVVSIVVIAWNEERNIFDCLSSLAAQETCFSYEIIVVNNNSSDRTQEILDRLHVKSYVQMTQGCGPARQMGQENAKGMYILLADADCLYPKKWLQLMIDKVEEPDVVCAYGRYSFIGELGYPRWKLVIYEFFKDMIAEIRHWKRPYLNAFGMSMVYVRDLGLKIGFVGRHIRGEDGRMCFDLMKFGKVVQVRSSESRVWTQPRTLQIEGSFFRVLFNRLTKELKRLPTLFLKHPNHDTKLSSNE